MTDPYPHSTTRNGDSLLGEFPVVVSCSVEGDDCDCEDYLHGDADEYLQCWRYWKCRAEAAEAKP